MFCVVMTHPLKLHVLLGVSVCTLLECVFGRKGGAPSCSLPTPPPSHLKIWLGGADVCVCVKLGEVEWRDKVSIVQTRQPPYSEPAGSSLTHTRTYTLLITKTRTHTHTHTESVAPLYIFCHSQVANHVHCAVLQIA